MNFAKQKIIFLLLMIYNIFAYSQKILSISLDSSCYEEFKKNRIVKPTLNESESYKEANNIIFTLFKKGYLKATYTNIQTSTDTIFLNLSCGRQFYYKTIHINLPKTLKLKEIKNFKFNYDEVHGLMNKILNYYENNGYPFAMVFFDEVYVKDTTITATLKCNPGKRINIDTIVNKGNIQITKSVYLSLLGLYENMPYNNKKISDIQKRIKQYNFIEQKKSPDLIFRETTTSLYLYLDKKRSNSFDGIIGFIPERNNENKILVTGDVTLNLTNSLKYAETFQLYWKKYDRLSQDIKINLNIPAIVVLPFGLRYNFFMLKKDTSFINVENYFGTFYNQLNSSKVGSYYKIFSSSLISVDRYKQINKLPPNLDMQKKSVGFVFESWSNNFFDNKSTGYRISLDLSTELKEIKKNISLPDTLYKHLRMHETNYKIAGDVNFILALSKKSSLLFRNNAGFLYSKNLFENELFTLGGLKSFRGFDEYFFFASVFSVQTIELRYFFEANSWFSVFCDMGYLEKKTFSAFTVQRPISLGTGLTLETAAGLFSIYYAMGKLYKQPFELKSAKVHFGYTAVF